MSLVKSISGIRGTVGGKPGEGLTAIDIVKFTAAFAFLIKGKSGNDKIRIVIGRDGRTSGEMISNLVTGTLISMGANVTDIGLTTTPTTEIAVTEEKADGGIIITASHNPRQWNALKFLNGLGEFLSEVDGNEVLQLSDNLGFPFEDTGRIGTYTYNDSYLKKHINKILNLPLVDPESIKKSKFTIVVDGVNSTGGIAVPMLLKSLGVSKIIELNCEPDGDFRHDPEPLPENISEACEKVSKTNADLGIVVDPDVDRLAIINEVGEPFGEEYTLVAVADYILKYHQGNTVSNLSSSQVLRIITEKAGGQYFASAVGEVHVVEMMKAKKAVIGGEGNGGIIYPELHYGRDALAGIALFLSHLARSKMTCSSLRDTYPTFYISKNKIELSPEMDIDLIFRHIIKKYKSHPVTIVDGVKIHFENEWVHLRRSNTEHILRIYAESNLMEKADHLARKITMDIREIFNGQ